MTIVAIASELWFMGNNNPLRFGRSNLSVLERQTSMNRSSAHFISTLASILGVSLVTFTVASLPRSRRRPRATLQYARNWRNFAPRSAKSAPPERIKTYEKGIEEVRRSGATEKALKVGDRAPDFELPDATGKKVKLSDLRARGPVVLTWYRGGLVPVLQYRSPRLSQEPARDPGRWRQPGRDLARDARQQHEHRGEKSPRIRDLEATRGTRSLAPTECLTRSPRSSRTSSRGDSTWPSTTAMIQANSPLGVTYVIDSEGSHPLRIHRRGLSQEGRARRSDRGAPWPGKKALSQGNRRGRAILHRAARPF